MSSQDRDSTNRPAVICLLAGHSSRMGSPKQHVFIHGATFLEHLLARIEKLRDRLGTLVFVGQARDEKTKRRVESSGGTWIINPRPDEGPLSSLRLGLQACSPETGFLLWPIDHPLVAVATVGAILDKVADEPGSIIAPSDGTRRGHPSYFPAWTREELFSAPLEAGAKWVLQRHPDRIVHIVTDDPWIRCNINTPELLAAAEADFHP
ncbi:MAG TPA: nucleotidyltransferase family protein [Candidatus Ozemobacteraceae bacterium]|nr:nucleotidyltransferase family protein [Candidatus Ozemobacteraceae bacterium]